MERLIDADALWRKFENEHWYDNADRDEIALPLVDDAPTVYAVEVVRCEKCKNAVWDEKNEMWKCVESAEYDEELDEWF